MDVTRKVEVSGSPDTVAALVGDLSRWPEWFALWKGWSAEPPPGEPRVGTKFRHKIRVLGVAGDMEWEIVEVDVPRRFKLKGRGPSRTSAKLDVRITPAGEGRSEVEFAADMGGLVLKPVERQLRPWLDVRIERTLVSLEELLTAA